MGYDRHITRAAVWPNSQSDPITMEEWLAYVATDPELQRIDRDIAYPPGREPDARGGKGDVEWTAARNGAKGWFFYGRGEITSNNPERAAIAKMFRIATALRANLLGDDGEHYDANGEDVRQKHADTTRRPGWLNWLSRRG